MHGHIGAQDVGQHQSVARVGLLAGDAVPVAVAGSGHRIDRKDLPIALPQGRDQEATAGFDGDRNRVVFRVAVLGEQVQQQPAASRVVSDAALGQQLSGVRPGRRRDASQPSRSRSRSSCSSSSALASALVTSACGPRGSLIPGLFGPTSHKPFAAPARPTGLGLVQSSRLGIGKRSP